MPGDRRRARLEAVAAGLEASRLHALLIASRPNVQYLTGFTGSAALVVVTRADVLLVTDSRYDEQAHAEAAAVARVAVESASVWDRLFKELPTLGRVEAIGYEAHVLTVKEAERLSTQAAPARPWRWWAAGEMVEGLRARKDPDEVGAIRAAAALACEAFHRTLAEVRPGLTELEITAVLEGHLRRLGSEGHPFPTIVASGPRSALPHARSGTRPVGTGEWLLMDFGATVDGYCADITRTVMVGARATDTQRALYDLVRLAQLRAREGLRAGMTGAEADALAREVIDGKGFGHAFGHSTGHGLGLEVHEAPRLAKTNADPLPAGAVVTVEPGVYLAGRGGVRIEDDVHIGAEGPELLSDGRTELVDGVGA